MKGNQILMVLMAVVCTWQIQGQVVKADSTQPYWNGYYEERLNACNDYWDISSMASSLIIYSNQNTSNAHLYNATNVFVNYHLNVDSMVELPIIEQELNIFSTLLGKAIKEISTFPVKHENKDEWTSLKNLLTTLNYSVQNLPVDFGPYRFSFEKLAPLTKPDFENKIRQLKAFHYVAKRTISANWNARKKLIAYKYLAFNLLDQPLVSLYINEPMAGLIRHDFESTILNFHRVGLDDAPYYIQNANLWHNAPRLDAGQLSIGDNSTNNRAYGVSNVEATNNETRVTVCFDVYSQEQWFYFDQSIYLIDTETKDRYPILRMENTGLTLNQGFIATGCEGKRVEFTLIFPPLKKQVAKFQFRYNRTKNPNTLSYAQVNLPGGTISLSDYSPASLAEDRKKAIQTSINSYVKAFSKLNEQWDLLGGTNHFSDAFEQGRKSTSGKLPTYSIALYGFRLNETASTNDQAIDSTLGAFLNLIEKAFDEYAETVKKNTGHGSMRKLADLIQYMGYAVSNETADTSRMDFSCSRLSTLTTAEQQLSNVQTKELIKAVRLVKDADWDANKKLWCYKYAAMVTGNLPWVKKYIDPEFVRLAREGGATTDTLVFMRIGRAMAPYIAHDSYIWKHAPRLWSNQLVVYDASMASPKALTSIELTPTETRVKSRYTVGGNEIWFRFDKTLSIVDTETDEKYTIRRVENNVPLNETFVVVGCGQKVVEFTLIFPPLKSTLKTFRFKDFITDQSNIMGDGSASVDSSLTYDLKDYVKSDSK